MAAALIGLLCLLWPLAAARDRHVPTVSPAEIAVPSALFGGVVAWALLQTSALLSGVLPDAWIAPSWSAAAVGLGGDEMIVGRVANDDFAARTGVMRWLCYAGVFWLALQHGRSERGARRLIDALALGGAAYAVYGLLVFASGNETILWLSKWAYHTSLTSTFVNRNTFATYAGLTLLCMIVATARRLERPIRIRSLLLHCRRPTAIFALAIPAGFVALLASGSRAGTASAVLGIVALAGGLWAAGRPPGPARRRIMMITCAWVAASFLTAIGILTQTDAVTGDFSARLRTYELTLELIAERPWTGHGLGAFAAVFASIRPPDVDLVWSEAHDTYLELAVELGVAGAAALTVAVMWLLGICVRGLAVRRRDGIYPALGAAATLLVGMHALFDFSLQIPGLTVTWIALLGVGVAQSRSSTATAPV